MNQLKYSQTIGYDKWLKQYRNSINNDEVIIINTFSANDQDTIIGMTILLHFFDNKNLQFNISNLNDKFNENVLLFGNNCLNSIKLRRNIEKASHKIKSLVVFYPIMTDETIEFIKQLETKSIDLHIILYDLSQYVRLQYNINSKNIHYIPLDKMPELNLKLEQETKFENNNFHRTLTIKNDHFQILNNNNLNSHDWYVLVRDNLQQMLENIPKNITIKTNCLWFNYLLICNDFTTKWIQGRKDLYMGNFNAIESIQNINLISIPSWIIMLERDSRRTLNVTKNLIPYLQNWTLFSAIDGDNKSEQLEKFLENRDNFMFDNAYFQRVKRGQLGCWFSHVSLWEKMLKEYIPMAIILEDDAKVSDEFYPKLYKHLAELPENWNMLYLYVFPKHRKNDETVQLDGKQYINKGYRTYCTTSYVITYKGAALLYGMLQNIFANIDNQIGALIERDTLTDTYMPKENLIENVGQDLPTPDAKLPSNIWKSDGFLDSMRNQLKMVKEKQ